ncbi:MAG: phosphoribosylanthranilate isomerase [Xanthomonadales bacterium]|nr:phosphoribosylanthranilate isomerase [Xanthomonadales bacterium]
MNTPKVKICCIQDADEARMAIKAGAWALGLVAEMPSGPGPLPDKQIANILQGIPAGVETFLLTSRVEADALIEHHAACPATTLQLVDHVPFAELHRLREGLPGVRLVQVIHVQDEGSVEEAARVAPLVDMILLDSGKPNAELRTLGGTGDIHDWTLSRRIRERINIPMFLAGGLQPGNVAGAVQQVQPFGVDLCSGIRDADGRLVPEKLHAFMQAVLG